VVLVVAEVIDLRTVATLQEVVGPLGRTTTTDPCLWT
jgi:hypothetical protein